MYRLVKSYIVIALLIFLQLGTSYAQITNSPYSIFGLGQMEGNNVGANIAMGGTGIAFLSDQAVNVHNPASYSGLDSLITIFQIGAFGKYTDYKNARNEQALVNGNIRYVTMGFRITPWLATSFGFTPFSSIGYKINTSETILGTDVNYTKTFSGEGGVNQFYLGTSVEVVKNLSLGVNASYLFGNITQTESATDLYFSLKDVNTLSNFSFNYGLNYQFNIRKVKYNVGLIYNNSKRLITDHEITMTTTGGTEILNCRNNKFSLPRNFGAGFAVTKGFFKAGIDFELSKWADVDFTNSNLRTRNSERYSFGLEFPSLGYKKGTNRMILYRLGGEYHGSYYVIKGEPINYYAVTLGAGLPLKGIVSTVNIALELGQNGTMAKGLFQERFCTLHLDLSLRDLWFRQRQYE